MQSPRIFLRMRKGRVIRTLQRPEDRSESAQPASIPQPRRAESRKKSGAFQSDQIEKLRIQFYTALRKGTAYQYGRRRAEHSVKHLSNRICRLYPNAPTHASAKERCS